jgi:DNA polymerase III subunit delta
VSKAALQTVRDAIKRGSFEPAYYIFGDDDFQKEDAIKQLQFAALDPATRDFNLESRRGPELDEEMLATLLATPPMMAERRVVIVRDVGGLKKNSRRALDSYLEAPATDVLLLLTTAAGGKTDDALAERAVPLKFDELSGDRLPKWIAHTAQTVHGLSISEGAIELLQSSVGNDLYQLSTELDKLASYANGNAIDETAVAAIVGVTPGETITDFLDALGERDLARALPLVPLILSQPKMSGVSLVMALSVQMMAIAWGEARLREGATRGALAKEYFDLLKRSGAYAGRPWGSAAAAWTKAASFWKTVEIQQALDALLDADIALKESRISSEEQLIENIVLTICAADSVSAAA